jgi:hypothetical protein
MHLTRYQAVEGLTFYVEFAVTNSLRYLMNYLYIIFVKIPSGI